MPDLPHNLPASHHVLVSRLVRKVTTHVAAPGTADAHPDIVCDIAPKELPGGYQLTGYRVIRTLGEGGFGITYQAEDMLLQRSVVIKESFPGTLSYRQEGTMKVCLTGKEFEGPYNWALTSFLREARLLASLDHPNMAKVYSCFQANNTAYYVTKFIEGTSLADLANDYDAHGMVIPQHALWGLMVQMLDALDYLHSKGVLHRDIKPDNILITGRGVPVLIDFGAAGEYNGNTDNTGVVQSVGFSPPEQEKDGKAMGPWTDLYAFGATLYYTLTGKCLPSGRLREIYDNTPPLTARLQLRAHYHPKFLATIQKAISPKIEDRFQSAAEWLEALRAPEA